jgi:hypothetical protein
MPWHWEQIRPHQGQDAQDHTYGTTRPPRYPLPINIDQRPCKKRAERQAMEQVQPDQIPLRKENDPYHTAIKVG